MNYAEGKGPKQVKKQWPLGPMTSVYGNMGVNLNPATTPYPAQFTISGQQITNVTYISGTSYVANVATPGSLSPGLNLNVNGNGATDISLVCAPGSNESVQDSEALVVNLSAENGWSGSSWVSLQGTLDRYTGTTNFNSTNWKTIASGQVTTANVPVTFNIVGLNVSYNAYRLIASGGTGIIDWTMTGMFVDMSANNIGDNATDTNGNIGQTSIQDPRLLTLSGGVITVSGAPAVYENIRANQQTIIP